MGAVERWERQLRERLETASGSERPAILLEAVASAKPLIASRQITRPRAIATIHAIGSAHGIKSLKPDPTKAKGLFAGPPFHPDGPEAA
jgi:hypothetical protein